jgi:hypothetical protein
VKEGSHTFENIIMEDNTMFTLRNITHGTDGPDGPTKSPGHTFVKIQGYGNHGFQMEKIFVVRLQIKDSNFSD